MSVEETDIEVLALIDLGNYYDNRTPGIKELSEEMDSYDSLIKKRIKRLENRGYIKRLQRRASKEYPISLEVTKLGREKLEE